MRLSDIMSHLQLTIFPEIGLVLFLAVFAAICWRVLIRRGSASLETHALLPLETAPTPEATREPEGPDSHP